MIRCNRRDAEKKEAKTSIEKNAAENYRFSRIFLSALIPSNFWSFGHHLPAIQREDFEQGCTG
jgi:hypothetical protein